MNYKENLLTVASEKCSEIAHSISKAIRFGLRNHHPDRPETTNAEEIIKEYYQLQAVIEMMTDARMLPELSRTEISYIKERKKEDVRNYAELSRKLNLLSLSPNIMTKSIRIEPNNCDFTGSEDITLVSTIEMSNLALGHTYSLKTTIIDNHFMIPLTEKETTFIAGFDDMKLDIPIIFSSKGRKGKTVISIQQLTDKQYQDKAIISHENITGDNPTVKI